MRYIQIVKADDVETARRSYLEMLHAGGVPLPHGTEVFTEAVHRPDQSRESWLCYVSVPRPHAA